MANLIHLKVVTPMGVYIDKDVEIVTTKTTEGYIGLQKGNTPMVASLVISKLFINHKNTPDYDEYSISGGIVYVTKDSVTIITESIESKDQINASEIKRKIAALENKLKDTTDVHEVKKIEVSLKKAINRLNLVEGK